MENEGKKCFRCDNFKRFYTKGIKQYDKTKLGWCREKHGEVNACDCCEQFEIKVKSKRLKNRVRYCLNELLTELTEIRKVLERDGEDEDETM